VTAREVVTPLAILLLAFLVRALPWRWHLEAGRVHFHGNDAYYHARRILHALHESWEILRVDSYLGFPRGGEPIWPPLFDFAVLAPLGVLGGGEVSFEQAALWIPPLIGTLTVACVMWIARLWFGRREAWVAGLVLALLPAHFAHSRIGFLDHHTAVTLVFALLLLVSGQAARRWMEGGRAIPQVGWALVVGGFLGGGLLLWPGMLLHLGIVDGLFLAVLFTTRDASEARRQSWLLCLAHAAACAVVAPEALGTTWRVWGSFSPVVLSDFQPWLLSSIAAFFALLALLLYGLPGRSTRLGRLGLALLAGALTLAALTVLTPDLGAAAGQAWGWLAKQESFQSGVAESRPLLVEGGRPSLRFALTHLSGLLLLLPLLLTVAYRDLRRERSLPRAMVLWCTAAMLAVALMQSRFIGCLAVALALLVAACTRTLLARLTSRWRVVAALALAMVVFVPCLDVYGPHLGDQVRWLRGLPPELDHLTRRKRILVSVADFLREHTEPTAGYLDPTRAPEYGILSRWTDGHLVRYVARRPMVIDNFGDDVAPENFELSKTYYESPEARGSEILEALGVRYVIFEHRRASGPIEPRSLFSRLYFDDGGAALDSVAVEDGRLRRVRGPRPAVRRHRLVYESEPKRFGASPERPGFKVYEHVAGARLRGRTRPQAAVRARLELRTNQSRAFDFVATTRADRAGCFEIRFPYATSDAPAAVSSGAEVEIQSGGRIRRVVIPERAVQEGLLVRVPDPVEPGELEGDCWEPDPRLLPARRAPDSG
jgi:asparagine N-glycosylation enzyme membrane subunit Stt3